MASPTAPISLDVAAQLQQIAQSTSDSQTQEQLTKLVQNIINCDRVLSNPEDLKKYAVAIVGSLKNNFEELQSKMDVIAEQQGIQKPILAIGVNYLNKTVMYTERPIKSSTYQIKSNSDLHNWRSTGRYTEEDDPSKIEVYMIDSSRHRTLEHDTGSINPVSIL